MLVADLKRTDCFVSLLATYRRVRVEIGSWFTAGQPMRVKSSGSYFSNFGGGFLPRLRRLDRPSTCSCSPAGMAASVCPGRVAAW